MENEARIAPPPPVIKQVGDEIAVQNSEQHVEGTDGKVRCFSKPNNRG
jgi:hypothetical protein